MPKKSPRPLEPIVVHKPYGVLSQWTDQSGRPTLSDSFHFPGLYPVGRLDHDSEGALLLAPKGRLHSALTQPGRCFKTYWAQVEGLATTQALTPLQNGIQIRDYRTRPAKVRILPDPQLPDRIVPIRYRANIPTSWLELIICEGKNRQVRKMTAAVGLPTLRLVRVKIGEIELGDLASGQWRPLSPVEKSWCARI